MSSRPVPGLTQPLDHKAKQSKNQKKRDRKRRHKETAAIQEANKHEPESTEANSLENANTYNLNNNEKNKQENISAQVANLDLNRDSFKPNQAESEKAQEIIKESNNSGNQSTQLEPTDKVPPLEEKVEVAQETLPKSETIASQIINNGGSVGDEKKGDYKKQRTDHAAGSERHYSQHSNTGSHAATQQGLSGSGYGNERITQKSSAASQQGPHQGYDQRQGQGGYQHQSQQYYEYTEVDVSKELVRILRHGAYKWLKLDDEGFVPVGQILQDRKFSNKFPGVTSEMIHQIVVNNEKKRFEMELHQECGYRIKATQGHSVKVQNLALTPITDSKDYPEVVHGTYLDAWQQIKKQGLKRMNRTHIHFAIGMPGDEDVLSGMRNSSDVVISLNLSKALEAGLKFFLSSNKVILSEGDKRGRIHPKFFEKATQYYPRRMLQFEVPPDYDDKEEEKSRRDNKRGSNWQQGSDQSSRPKQHHGGDKRESGGRYQRGERSGTGQRPDRGPPRR